MKYSDPLQVKARWKGLVSDEMIRALPDLKVLILVEVGMGNTWLEAN